MLVYFKLLDLRVWYNESSIIKLSIQSGFGSCNVPITDDVADCREFVFSGMHSSDKSFTFVSDTNFREQQSIQLITDGLRNLVWVNEQDGTTQQPIFSSGSHVTPTFTDSITPNGRQTTLLHIMSQQCVLGGMHYAVCTQHLPTSFSPTINMLLIRHVFRNHGQALRAVRLIHFICWKSKRNPVTLFI